MSENNTNQKNLILKDEEHLVLDHNYDGIQELDHPLPRWWVWMFYLTIIFSIFYLGYYMLGPGPTLREELEVALKKLESNKPQRPQDDEATFLALMNDSAHSKAGAEIYLSKCAACHGDKGQGLVGPNLTDDHWIHGEGSLALF